MDTSLPGGYPGKIQQPPLDEFRAAGLLDDLADDAARRLVDVLRPVLRRLVDGEYLCRSGEEATAFWILRNGQVRIEDFASGGSPQYLRARSQGEVLGEVGYIASDKSRSASIRANGPVELYEIQYARLNAVDEPGLQSHLFRSLARFAADKFGQANKHRAELAAEGIRLTELVRRFVPPSGIVALDTVAIGLRPDYQHETVVVLFSDIVGFSDIAAMLSADETAALMKRALDVQVAAIGQRHGEIDKFIGDAIMAFWIVHGDTPELKRQGCVRALNAALEAVADVAKIVNPLDGTPLRVRIGVHIGSAHSGNFGGSDRWAFTLIGHDVNNAARAEQARNGDVTSGHGQLGAVRSTHDFWACLPPEEQAKLPHRSDVKVKHTELKIFSSTST